MKLVFTICSNNYLAQAKVLGDSIRTTNPDYEFYICLVDQYSPVIDYEKEIGHKIILTENIGIPDFDDLWKKFSIIEFNTCVKPFFFEYFTSKYDDLEFLYYLDPDTFVFDSFKLIEKEFGQENNILLTPHILTPIELDGKYPDEPIFLNYGLYNLGFLGLKNPVVSLILIHWWKERTYKFGYNRTCEGLFVDQLWFNLVPILFEKVKISKHLGLNMGPWNLHERILSKSSVNYMVNNKYPLIFYHFSNYKYSQPEVLASYYNRFTFENRLDLKEIYEIYLERLIAIDISKISSISCFYMEKREEYLKAIQLEEQQRKQEQKKLERTYKWWTKKIIINVLPPFIPKIIKYLFNCTKK